MLNKSFFIEVDGFKAEFTVYVQNTSAEISPEHMRPMVVVCPGGGYMYTSDREAEPVAIALLAKGFNVGVLRYSAAPAKYPVALLQLAKALLLVRQNAKSWHVDEDNIHVMGFSAGGHLAASLATLWQDEKLAAAMPEHKPQLWRPRSAVLCYPVITAGKFAHRGSFDNLIGEEKSANVNDEMHKKLSLENSVSKNTVPCFLWHTEEDASVPVENSLMFAAALRKNGVPFELHIYPNGAHGLALGTKESISSVNPAGSVQPEVEGWIELAARWIKGQ